jgi:hypothetical protein
MTGASAAARAIFAGQSRGAEVRCLQELHEPAMSDATKPARVAEP